MISLKKKPFIISIISPNALHKSNKKRKLSSIGDISFHQPQISSFNTTKVIDNLFKFGATSPNIKNLNGIGEPQIPHTYAAVVVGDSMDDDHSSTGLCASSEVEKTLEIGKLLDSKWMVLKNW